MIIMLEGLTAAGKSTVAKLPASEYGFYRVQEVNELFPIRPNPEPINWYLERQIERSAIARIHRNCVLDGDIFQVAWLSWIYPERGFSTSFVSGAESAVENVLHDHVVDFGGSKIATTSNRSITSNRRALSLADS